MLRLLYLLLGIAPEREERESDTKLARRIIEAMRGEKAAPRRILTNHFIDWDFDSPEEYT